MEFRAFKQLTLSSFYFFCGILASVSALAQEKKCDVKTLLESDLDESAALSMAQNGGYQVEFTDRPSNQSVNRWMGQAPVPARPRDPLPPQQITEFKKGGVLLEPEVGTRSYRSGSAMNPTGFVADDGTIYVVPRCEDSTGKGKWHGVSRPGLFIADPANGMKLKPALLDSQGREKPLMTPEFSWEAAGIEDNRIVKLKKPIIYEGKSYRYHMTYSGYDYKQGLARIAQAISDDGIHWKKLGLIFKDEDVLKNPAVPHSPWTKSGVVFQLDDGSFIMYFGEGRIPMAKSKDGVHWDYPIHDQFVLTRRNGYPDQGLVEPSTGFIDHEGIHLLYFGDAPPDGYVLLEAVFDKNDPTKIIRRSNVPILKPDQPYEIKGQVDRVVFGQFRVEHDHKIYFFEGAGDSRTAYAYAYAPVAFKNPALAPIYQALAQADISNAPIAWNGSQAKVLAIHPNEKDGGTVDLLQSNGTKRTVKLAQIGNVSLMEKPIEYALDQKPVPAVDLVAEHRKKMHASLSQNVVSTILNFSGLLGKDAYNPTAFHNIKVNGKRTQVMEARVESPNSETDSEVRRYTTVAGSNQRLMPIPNAPVHTGQDPALFEIGNEIIHTHVEVYSKGKDANGHEMLGYRQAFFRDDGKGLEHLGQKPFAYGPDGMKDIRLLELPNKKILVMTRPQGAVGGRGKIGFVVIDKLEDLTPKKIESAKILNGLFLPEEWGGANEVVNLSNGKVGVLGHIARYDSKNNRHYTSIVFALDPVTGAYTRPEVIAEMKDLGKVSIKPKKPDLADVVFTGGIERHSDGKAIITLGVRDRGAARIEMLDPFTKYEQEP